MNVRPDAITEEKDPSPRSAGSNTSDPSPRSAGGEEAEEREKARARADAAKAATAARERAAQQHNDAGAWAGQFDGPGFEEPLQSVSAGRGDWIGSGECRRGSFVLVVRRQRLSAPAAASNAWCRY